MRKITNEFIQNLKYELTTIAVNIKRFIKSLVQELTKNTGKVPLKGINH